MKNKNKLSQHDKITVFIKEGQVKSIFVPVSSEIIEIFELDRVRVNSNEAIQANSLYEELSRDYDLREIIF